jgi:hypothetical protein
MLVSADLAEFLLGDDIQSAIGISFADYLENMADKLDGMDLSGVSEIGDDSSEMPAPAEALRPNGIICRLASFGGKYRYSAG